MGKNMENVNCRRGLGDEPQPGAPRLKYSWKKHSQSKYNFSRNTQTTVAITFIGILHHQDNGKKGAPKLIFRTSPCSVSGAEMLRGVARSAQAPARC